MKAGKKVLSLLFWLVVWAAAAAIIKQELYLPSPLSVLKALCRLIVTGAFWLTVLHTMLSVVVGFAVGAAAGVLFAGATVASRTAELLLSPAIRALRAVPVVSFITLALLWIGKAAVPILISALMVMPIIWQAVSSSIRLTDPMLLEMADVYRFGAWKKLRLLYVPSVLPQFRSACLTAMGLSWKSGVAAEVLCQVRHTIGAEIHYSRIYLETPALFAWTAVVVVLSIALEKAVKRLSKGVEKP